MAVVLRHPRVPYPRSGPVLREIAPVRQYADEPWRRWFFDERLELVVWTGRDEGFRAFQLSYDRPHRERVVTWRCGGDWRHEAVDTGDRPGRHAATPLLVADGPFPAARVRADFEARADALDPVVRDFVLAGLDALRADADRVAG